jgi:hypothetical protein
MMTPLCRRNPKSVRVRRAKKSKVLFFSSFVKLPGAGNPNPFGCGGKQSKDFVVAIPARAESRSVKEFVTLPGESYPSSALVDACYTLLFAPKSAALK